MSPRRDQGHFDGIEERDAVVSLLTAAAPEISALKDGTADRILSAALAASRRPTLFGPRLRLATAATACLVGTLVLARTFGGDRGLEKPPGTAALARSAPATGRLSASPRSDEKFTHSRHGELWSARVVRPEMNRPPELRGRRSSRRLARLNRGHTPRSLPPVELVANDGAGALVVGAGNGTDPPAPAMVLSFRGWKGSTADGPGDHREAQAGYARTIALDVNSDGTLTRQSCVVTDEGGAAQIETSTTGEYGEAALSVSVVRETRTRGEKP